MPTTPARLTPSLASSPQPVDRRVMRTVRRAGLRIAWSAAAALAALAASPSARAADDDAVVKETRAIGAFKSVRLVGSADLVITQSDTPSLTVEGPKESMRAFIAETRGDELVLRYEPRDKFVWWKSDSRRHGPRFLLAANVLERIATAGNGDVRAEAWTSTGDFEISVTGGSDIRIGALAARKLLVRISGSGDVSLAGGVLEQNVKISGSGDYKCKDLKSATATIAIAGSGDAAVSVRDTLSVKIAGSGDVKYYGQPTITKSIAGSGSVTGLGDKP